MFIFSDQVATLMLCDRDVFWTTNGVFRVVLTQEWQGPSEQVQTCCEVIVSWALIYKHIYYRGSIVVEKAW